MPSNETLPSVVVALMGLPGAGKSTLARALATEIGARVVDRDAIRAALFPQCSYSPTERRATTRAVLLALEVDCALGHACIVDGMTFARARERERVAEVARRFGHLFVPLWLDVPVAVAQARVAADAGAHPAHDRDPALVERVAARFEAVASDASRLDATQSAAAVASAALAAIRARLQQA
jgi:predicted kinase